MRRYTIRAFEGQFPDDKASVRGHRAGLTVGKRETEDDRHD